MSAGCAHRLCGGLVGAWLGIQPVVRSDLHGSKAAISGGSRGSRGSGTLPRRRRHRRRRCFGGLGNVEAVAVARGNVDEKRAVGSGSGSYLASLDADERPLKGVHVDDPKAMFLLRWYQEVDANGTVFKDTNGTETYQNRGCKGYYLPLDNGSYAFEWTSMHQVMTAVHLKPHSSKSRTFTLPAGDKKTVTEAFNCAVAAAF